MVEETRCIWILRWQLRKEKKKKRKEKRKKEVGPGKRLKGWKEWNGKVGNRVIFIHLYGCLMGE